MDRVECKQSLLQDAARGHGGDKRGVHGGRTSQILPPRRRLQEPSPPGAVPSRSGRGRRSVQLVLRLEGKD